MTSIERWREVSPYLEQALDIADPSERAAWVSSLRTHAPALAADLEDMLNDHRALADASFLEQQQPFGHRSRAGERVGAYTLVEPIGDGGMASVWLAKRDDGRFERQVAVKFVNAFLPARGVERFTREGQLLAGLAHPHIAQLIDAGVSATGQPYLILEYVDGEPIDRYADRQQLDIHARIGLFLQVLAAVAHAHANLIVHRDVKPSNVFVARNGEVKLLDFGVAKLLNDDSRPGDPTQLTREGGSALTPVFAAPEQLTAGPITTATDVYALGVLLFVLLTGEHPSGLTGASPADVVKAVVGTEARRPSEAVARTEFRRVLRGDLDTIVGKALKKQPQARYETATAFADDLRRFLRHEPIAARPDSVGYRASRFVRRHWLAVMAATVAIAALAVSLFFVNRERLIAEQRFGQLRRLSAKVLDFDSVLDKRPGSTDLRRLLVSTSLEYLEGLAAETHGDVDLILELARAYLRIAKIQGVPTQSNLGDSAGAARNLETAERLTQELLALRPRDHQALFTAASVAEARMILAQSEARNVEAFAIGQQAATYADAVLRVGLIPEIERGNAATIIGNVALASVNMHRYGDGVRYARRQLEIVRGWAYAQSQVPSALSVLANALRFEGDLDGALNAIREARAAVERTTYPNENLRLFNMYGVLLREGLILGEDGVSLNRPKEAVEPLQKALDMVEAASQQDPRDATSRTRAATTEREIGNIFRRDDPQRALAAYDVALARLAEVPTNLKVQRDRAVTLAESAYALHRLHRGAEARQRIDEALAILRETRDLPKDRVELDSPAYIVLRVDANDLEDSGRSRDAWQHSQRLLENVLRVEPPTSTDLRDMAALSALYDDAARHARRAGDTAGAEAIASQRIELWRQWQGRLPDNAFVARQLLAAQ